MRAYNDRGEFKVRLFVTEGIIPGTVATASGWTPDTTLENTCYQNLTHFTICDAEEAYSETNSAFYDVLVEVEKVADAEEVPESVIEKTASTVAAEGTGMDDEDENGSATEAESATEVESATKGEEE